MEEVETTDGREFEAYDKELLCNTTSRRGYHAVDGLVSMLWLERKRGSRVCEVTDDRAISLA